MKCLFCQQHCSFREKLPGEVFYSSTGLHWVCQRHPLEVVHLVQQEFYSTRKNRNIRGQTRLWSQTYLCWDTVQLPRYNNLVVPKWVARFYRGAGWEMAFQLLKRSGLNIHYESVLELQEHPKGVTPENIVEKMKTYLVFS
jgi:hypothetical protein